MICGTSPHALANIDKIKPYFDKYITVGLNYFPLKCDYRFIVDHSTMHNCYQNGERLVIHNQLVNELNGIDPYFVYTIGQELDCINSVCEPAIQYASKNGADNIVLYGVDLTSDWQPASRTDVTKQVIYSYPNVYKLNKKSEVNVPLWTEINLN